MTLGALFADIGVRDANNSRRAGHKVRPLANDLLHFILDYYVSLNSMLVWGLSWTVETATSLDSTGISSQPENGSEIRGSALSSVARRLVCEGR